MEEIVDYTEPYSAGDQTLRKIQQIPAIVIFVEGIGKIN